MFHDQEEENYLADQAPNLYHRERKNPFNVPENYFDELPGLIQNRILNARKVSLSEKIIGVLFKPQVAVVVILISVLAIGSVFFFGSHNGERRFTAYVITNEDLKNPDLVGGFDENMLFDEYTAVMEQADYSPSANSEIEDYLIENQTDVNQIYNEL